MSDDDSKSRPASPTRRTFLLTACSDYVRQRGSDHFRYPIESNCPTVSWMTTHWKETLMKRILLLFAVVIVAGVVVGQAQVTRTDAKPAPQNAKEVRGALPEGGSMPKDPYRGSSRKAFTNYVQDTDVADFVLTYKNCSTFLQEGYRNS